MVAETDDSVVDVDFTTDPNYVGGDLGCALCGDYQEFGDEEEVYSDEQIEAELDKQEAAGGGTLDELVKVILNQKREGSCVGNAITQAVMVILALQFGKAWATLLSAISIYKQIGRSASSGAMVSDAMDAVRDVGILPLDTPANRAKYGDHVMPATGFSTRFPAGFEATAAKFKGFEFLVIRGMRQLLTALLKGYPVVVGRQGHSIVYLRLMRRNGRRVVMYANSWDETWGDEGFGYDTEQQFRQSASWAFAVGVKTTYGVRAANSTAMGTALASAVAAMVAGDTVTVNGPATYTITASLNPPAGTSLIGIGKPLIAASGTTDATIIVDNNDILVRGFSIETNLLGVGKLTATPFAISGVVVEDVDVSITSSQGSGVQWSQSIGGGTVEHTVDAQIRNCNHSSGSVNGFGLFAYLATGSNLYIYDTNTNGKTDGILVGGSSGAECFVFGGEHLSTLDAVTSGGPPIRIVGSRLRGSQANAYSDGGPVYLHGCDHRYTSDAGAQTYEVIGGQALQLINQDQPVIPIAMGGTNGATAAEARTNLGVSVRTIQIAPFGVDGTTAAGDGKWRYRVPASMNGAVITAVNLNLQDDSSSGAVDFDVARDRGGSVVDVLSTNLTVDATEFDSSTAAAAAVINAANDDLATGDILRVDCDGAGTGAKGPLLTIEVTK